MSDDNLRERVEELRDYAVERANEWFAAPGGFRAVYSQGAHAAFVSMAHRLDALLSDTEDEAAPTPRREKHE